jgi:YidC/Oxa1 family membrane protein insertase
LPELNLELVKRYTLTPVPAEHRDNELYPGYHLRLDIEVRNTGEEPRSLAYRLDGPTGMPTEGWWYAHKISQTWSGAGLRDVVVRFDGLKFVQLSASKIAGGDVPTMGEGKSLAFAGVDGQYFSSILIPELVVPNDAWIETTEAVRVGPKLDPAMPAFYNNVTCRLTRRPVTLAAGESQTDSFQVFIGPKRPDLLAQYQPGGNPANSLADVVYYGWPLFAAVARWMVWILHIFYSLVGNYGIAVVMLTVVVRGAMFPLSWKQTQSMARMQALKPEMDRITEKYKGDMQKRSQELQALYRKHNINPLGGCLPVFLQLPIFVGLYKGLMIDVELRGSPLLGHSIRWCSNLAAPDMLID